jgi:hypothetical protein
MLRFECFFINNNINNKIFSLMYFLELLETNCLLMLGITMDTNLLKKSHSAILSDVTTKLIYTNRLIDDLIKNSGLNDHPINFLSQSQKDQMLRFINKISDLLTECSKTSIVWRTCIEGNKKILLEMYYINKNSIYSTFDLEKKINNVEEYIKQIKNHLTKLNQIFFDIENFMDQEKEMNKFTINIFQKSKNPQNNSKETLKIVFEESDYHLNYLQEHILDVYYNLINQNNPNEIIQIINECLREHQKILEGLDLFDKTIVQYDKKYIETLMPIQTEINQTYDNNCIIQ